jgi:hypothetical protein
VVSEPARPPAVSRIGWRSGDPPQALDHSLCEYMRDYNHWATVGVLNELLAQPDNRVTLSGERDQYGMPVARFDYSLCDNDKANMKFSAKVIHDIVLASGAQDVR